MVIGGGVVGDELFVCRKAQGVLVAVGLETPVDVEELDSRREGLGADHDRDVMRLDIVHEASHVVLEDRTRLFGWLPAVTLP